MFNIRPSSFGDTMTKKQKIILARVLLAHKNLHSHDSFTTTEGQAIIRSIDAIAVDLAKELWGGKKEKRDFLQACGHPQYRKEFK